MNEPETKVEAQTPLKGVRYELPPDEFADYLSNRAADIADKRISRRETLWRGLTAAVIAALGLLGYTSITSNISGQLNEIDERVAQRVQAQVAETLPVELDGLVAALRPELQLELSDRIDTALSEEISELSRQIRQSQDLALYLAVVNRLSLSETARLEDADIALSVAERLVSDPTITQRREFVLASEYFIRVMENGFLSDRMDRIFELAGPVLITDKSIWAIFLRHYLYRILGEPIVSEKLQKTYATLQNEASRHGYEDGFAEHALLGALLYDYRENGERTKDGEFYAERLKDLDSDSIDFLRNELIIASNIHNDRLDDVELDFVLAAAAKLIVEAASVYELGDLLE